MGGWLEADIDAAAEDDGGGAPLCRNQAWPSAAVGLRARCTAASASCCDGRVRACVVARMPLWNVTGSFAVLMSVKVDRGRASSDALQQDPPGPPLHGLPVRYTRSPTGTWIPGLPAPVTALMAAPVCPSSARPYPHTAPIVSHVTQVLLPHAFCVHYKVRAPYHDGRRGGPVCQVPPRSALPWRPRSHWPFLGASLCARAPGRGDEPPTMGLHDPLRPDQPPAAARQRRVPCITTTLAGPSNTPTPSLRPLKP